MSSTSAVRVAVGRRGAWTEITDGSPADNASPHETLRRIHAADLRESQQIRLRARSEAIAAGDDADSVAVFLDVEIWIADDARTARREFAASKGPAVPSSIRYVGTPSGLAGLIADIGAAAVADGVTLIPVGADTRALAAVALGVVPWLEKRGVVFSAAAVRAATGMLPGDGVIAS